MIFPTNFLWGASTSAFQVEGGYNEGGKGVATTDLGARRPGIADNKVAADHYHHWKEQRLLVCMVPLLQVRSCSRLISRMQRSPALWV